MTRPAVEPATADGGVALTRLLALAPPTPPQALELGLGLLDALMTAAAKGRRRRPSTPWSPPAAGWRWRAGRRRRTFPPTGSSPS